MGAYQSSGLVVVEVHQLPGVVVLLGPLWCVHKLTGEVDAESHVIAVDRAGIPLQVSWGSDQGRNPTTGQLEYVVI